MSNLSKILNVIDNIGTFEKETISDSVRYRYIKDSYSYYIYFNKVNNHVEFTEYDENMKLQSNSYVINIDIISGVNEFINFLKLIFAKEIRINKIKKLLK